MLRYGDRLSDQQIADRVGITPRSVQADAEAGLLTLSPTLNGVPEPGRMVSAVLAHAGLRWAERWLPAAGAADPGPGAPGAGGERETADWAASRPPP